jgi:DNA topoisomerase I
MPWQEISAHASIQKGHLTVRTMQGAETERLRPSSRSCGMPQVSAPADPEKAHARAAGLVYVSDTEPGLRRKAAGTGFSYRLSSGKAIRDKETRARVRGLAVPPAWTEVWICPHADGHIQATGRDARGRKQYIYHADWREVRDRSKYERMLDFARLLPRIRARIDKDMSRRGMPREKVLATVVSLLDKTLVRVGNGDYAKQNGSYGLTTLRSRHLEVAGTELRFHFKGKSGKTWRLSVKDRRIARVVRSIQELPGQHLFQYLDDEGAVRSIDSTAVNDYLREIAGPDVSAKDFRTWAGTVLAVLALSALGEFTSQTQAKMNVRRAIEAVAGKLGNTPTICRKCYIHPEIVASYMEGTLPSVATDATTAATGSALPREEEMVLRLLKRRLAPGRKARKTSRDATVRPAA